MISVAFEFLTDISAFFKVCHGECPVGAGHISPNDRTACSAGIAAEITQFKAAALQSFSGFGVIFVHDEGTVRHIVHRYGLGGVGFQIELGHAAALNAEALGSGLLHQLVPATVYIGEGDFSDLIRCEHAEVVDLAGGGGIVRTVIDMEFGIGERIAGDAVPLQDRQGGFDRVEEGHRSGAARFQMDLLGDLRENDMGRHIFLRDAIATHGDGSEEDAPRAVRGGAGRKATVDLLDTVGHALDRLTIGDVLLDNFKTRLFIVNEDDFGGFAGAERHGLLGVRHHIRLWHGFFPYHINICWNGRESGGAIHTSCDRGGIVAGDGLHREHRAGDGFAAHGIPLGDLHVGQLVVFGGHGVLLVTIGRVNIDADGGRIGAVPGRSLCFYEAPQALGHIIDFDDATVFGHITADDLPVPVDVEYSAIQTGIRTRNDFFEGDVRIAGGRTIRFSRLHLKRELSWRIVGKKALAARHAGFGVDRPLCGLVLNDRSDRSLCGVFLDLLMELRVLLGLLR